MFEDVGQPLGAIRGLARHARRDRPGDQEKLPFHGGRHPAGSAPHGVVEPSHGSVESPHRGAGGVPTIPELPE